MYKTSVITDEISQDIRVAAQMAREYGLNGLEIRSVNERNPFFMTGDDIRLVKQVADDFGLEICGVSSPLFKCSIDDPATTQQHVEAFKRMMDTMALWNTKIIRGFPFFNLNDGEKRFGEVVEKFQPIIDTAKDAGVTVVIESEPSVYTANIESLSRFLKLIDAPCVQAVYDPGNESVDVGTPPPYPGGPRIDALADTVNPARLGNHPVEITREEIKRIYRCAFIRKKGAERQACLDIWRYYGK